MKDEECGQCNGSGKQTFHKGTPREYKPDCPSCSGTGLKNSKSRELNRSI